MFQNNLRKQYAAALRENAYDEHGGTILLGKVCRKGRLV